MLIGRRRFPLKKIKIAVKPRAIRNNLFYIEGNINCNGEGNLVLARENGYSLNLYLPPGEYDYKVFMNQYHQVERKKKILVSREGYFLGNHLKYESSGFSIYFIYSSTPLSVIINGSRPNSKQSEVRSGKITRKYGRIYYFIKDNGSDLSLTINGKTQNIGKTDDSVEKKTSSKIIYQIFPDRFFKYKAKKTSKFSPWRSLPEHTSFYGGNLKGIIRKMQYLANLNIEYLYLNPVFKSHSNHRYDVDDYYEIDPMLGTKHDFKELVEEAHRKGIKIIMDMVFNHTSTYHRFFEDVLKNGEESKYYGYYIFHGKSFKRFMGHCNFSNGDTNCPSYETFMGYGMMPKLNLRNDEVRDYLRNVVKYWKNEFGIDGIRYDVANSLPYSFVAQIMSDNTDMIHIGEVWCASPLYARKGYYDGITNYFLRDQILSLVSGKKTIKEFLDAYYEFLFIYREKVDKCMNLLSSHDVERIKTVLSGNKNKILLAHTILFMMNGYSLIYYGDEIGMEGGKDPDCRRAFNWNSHDSFFFRYFKRLTDLRREYDIMKHGIVTDVNRAGLRGLSKISRDEKLNLYFGNKVKKIKIRGKILAGKGYLWVGHETIEMKENGFVLEYLRKF